jgi:hypothetical protein
MKILRRKCSKLVFPAVAVVFTLCIGAAPAGASAEIEGVWSFNGGTVDIQSQGGGTFRGVVVAATKFAQCSHPVNEDMWTDIRLQSDGSYWGLHQWYFESQPCVANPKLGPTAWRVLRATNGSRFLRVCFSAPDSNLQPVIAPGGASANVTYGCVDSGAIAPLPANPTKGGSGSAFTKVVILPKPKKCVASHSLTIKLRDPKYDPLKEVVIWVNRKKVMDIRNVKKLKKSIVLKHLPNGSYKIKVLAITVLNHRLSGGHTYNSCTKGSGKIKLVGAKPKHAKHHSSKKK